MCALIGSRAALLGSRAESVWSLALTQDGATAVLKPGNTVTHQLGGGNSKTFSVTLAAGNFASFRVEQHGSILLVSLFDPQDKLVIQMDYPAGGYGPIVFSTIATVSGNYRLQIETQSKWTNPANFDVTVEEVRNSTPDDQLLVAAYQDFAEGQKYLRNNDGTAALQPLNKAMSFWNATNNLRWQALTHFAIAQAYGDRDRPNAIKETEATLKILDGGMAPNDWRLKASALNDLGAYYANTNQVDRGIDLLNQALNLYAQNQDRRGQASSLNQLAIIHGRIHGNYSLALELVGKAIPLRYAENDLPGVANLRNTQAGIADALGEPDKALQYLLTAQEDWEKLPEIPPTNQRRVLTLLNLAAINDKLGHWEQARNLYDQGLKIFPEGDARRIATLDNKGELYASFDDFESAQKFYEDALKLLPPKDFDINQKAGLLVHLGQLSWKKGDLSGAVKLFEEAKLLKPAITRLPNVLTNLGAALAAQGKFEVAIETYAQALDIQKKLSDVRGQALTLQRRGEAYHLLNKPQALDDLKEALALWQSLKDVRGTAATLNALARAEQGRANFSEALRYSDQAIDVVESQRTTLSSRELRTAYFATQENYYVLNVQLNMQLSRATGDSKYLVRAFETNEKSRARVLLEALNESGITSNGENQAADKRLADRVERRLIVKNTLALKAEARTRLLNTNTKAVQLAIFDKEIRALDEESDALDAEIRSLNPQFASLTKPRPATLKEIQQQLDQDTLLVEYSLGEKQSYAWTVTTDSIRGFELPASGQIESVVLQLRQAIELRNAAPRKETESQRYAREDEADKNYAEAARILSDMVLKPLVSEFRKQRLLVIPDAALQNVSFASLPITESSASLAGKDQRPDAGITHLVVNHQIVVLPSASVIAVLRQQIASRPRPPQEIIILANPVFTGDDDRVKRIGRSSGAPSTSPATPSALQARQTKPASSALRSIEATNIPRLPFSQTEAQRILSVTPKGKGILFQNFAASRSLALSPEMARFRFIHFATHGIVDLERPALSRIILSLVDEEGRAQDGYLFLSDIYNLNLPVDLVVLSACQTGVGKQIKGEGLIALTRGFMYAGAARLVASYWDVNDAATADLMAEFYKQIYTNKKQPVEALQAAQLHLRSMKRWNSPVYWAGFFIQGEWK